MIKNLIGFSSIFYSSTHRGSPFKYILSMIQRENNRGLKKLIVLLGFIVIPAVFSANLASAQIDYLQDNAQYSSTIQQYEWKNSTDLREFSATLAFDHFNLAQDVDGIWAFQGWLPRSDIGFRYSPGLWWLQIHGGLAGELKPEAWTAQILIARAIITPTAKWTPYIKGSRHTLDPHALSTSLQSKEELVALGSKWEHGILHGELAFEMGRWRTQAQSGRVYNTDINQAPQPNFARTWTYVFAPLGSSSKLGFSGSYSMADTSTMVASTIFPGYTYTWYPASMSRKEWKVNLDYRWEQKWEHWELGAKLVIPALSYALRQWERRKIAYWGVAELSLGLNASYKTKTLALNAEAEYKNQPWENWNFQGSSAYHSIKTSLGLQKEF